MSIEPAPAKLNLALHVRGRRDDGYHELETLFAFTDFGDSLAAVPAASLSLDSDGEFAVAAGPGDDNLVLRAARALAAATGVRNGAALTLTKRIPVAAGLGGGSADAAAALRLLNRLWGLDRPIEWLEGLGADLGADVPACVASRTCFGTGRGERLLPVDIGMTGRAVLIVNPRRPVPTGPVFAAWDGIDRGSLDPAADLATLRNDLTAPAVSIEPMISEALAWTAGRDGLALARMSGSGASVFGLFDRHASAVAAAAAVPPHWWATASHLR